MREGADRLLGEFCIRTLFLLLDLALVSWIGLLLTGFVSGGLPHFFFRTIGSSVVPSTCWHTGNFSSICPDAGAG